MEKVTILLATYNGEKYVAEQLDSILKQSHSNWQLLIRDDHSSDNTRQIIADYQRMHPDRIHFVDDDFGNVGSVQNFNILLQLAKMENYIMFCDQDDFWMPDKIEATLKHMTEVERQQGADCPILIHTNFQYVDTELNPIPSKENFRATRIDNLELSHFLAQNPVYGCTIMLNRSLANAVGSIPEIAENHDYWTAMVASAFGVIHYVDYKSILYRQHDKNVSGSFKDSKAKNRFKRILDRKLLFNNLTKKINMVKTFKQIYLRQLSEKQINLLDNFVKLSINKNINLFYTNIKNGVRKQGLSQTMLFYISMIFYKPSEYK